MKRQNMLKNVPKKSHFYEISTCNSFSSYSLLETLWVKIAQVQMINLLKNREQESFTLCIYLFQLIAHIRRSGQS